jgi:hypothetical protein
VMTLLMPQQCVAPRKLRILISIAFSIPQYQRSVELIERCAEASFELQVGSALVHGRLD